MRRAFSLLLTLVLLIALALPTVPAYAEETEESPEVQAQESVPGDGSEPGEEIDGGAAPDESDSEKLPESDMETSESPAETAEPAEVTAEPDQETTEPELETLEPDQEISDPESENREPDLETPDPESDAQESDSESSESDEDVPDTEQRTDWLLIGGIAGAVLVIGVVGLILGLRSRKKKKRAIVGSGKTEALESSPPSSKAPPVGNIRMTVTGGPQKGKSFFLNADEDYSFGIGENCRICLDSGYRYVSRLHGTVRFDNRSRVYLVTDQSTNGIYTAEKKRLPQGKCSTVYPGTVLLLGNEECSIILE